MKICEYCKKEISKEEINGNGKKYHKNCLKEKEFLRKKKWKENHPDYDKEYYQKNKDKAKEYREINKPKRNKQKREWDKKNKKHNKKYRQENRRKYNFSRKKWGENNKEKILAENKARIVKIPNGKLCQRCRKRLARNKHHPNYSKPLKVKFLCKKCHSEVHRELKEARADLIRKYGEVEVEE